MYKTDWYKSGQTNVIFVDIGHCDTQVIIAAFERRNVTILSHSYDQNMGGRDFDEVLFKHFATQFKEQCDINVYSNTHASTRLRASCEKLKKVLSDNAEAPICIDRLINDEDLKGFITREEFENLSFELLEKVTIHCVKALNDSGLSVDSINGLELVGSGSHIPAIRRKLTSLFQKEPRISLHAREYVAEGCALQCAMLSPTTPFIGLRYYEFQDSLPYTIGINLEEGKNNKPPNCVLFQRGSLFPSFKNITFHRSSTFYVEVYFTNETDFPVRLSPVSYFMIGPFETSGAEKAEVEVKFHVNINGIVKIKSALLLEDAHSSTHNTEATRKNLGFSENVYCGTTKYELLKALEIEHKLSEQDITAEHTKEKRNLLEAFVYDTRKKLRSSNSSIATDSEKERMFRILQETEDWLYEDGDDESEETYIRKLEDLIKLLDPIKIRPKKKVLAEQDKKVEENKDRRNTLESFVYDSRSKLSNAYRSFATESEKKVITDSLQETEDWLYEDRDDESEQYYTGKLNYLKKLLDPIENKYKYETARVQATKTLQTRIAMFDDSLPLSQKQQFNDECIEVQQYVNNNPPEIGDQWPSFIKNILDIFERSCSMMNAFRFGSM